MPKFVNLAVLAAAFFVSMPMMQAADTSSKDASKPSLPSLEQAAKSGDPDACRTLAEMYEKGDGVAPDQEKSARLFEKTALRMSRAKIGSDVSMLHGKQLPGDNAAVFSALKKAAEAGDTEALNKEAFSYQHGIGCQKSLSKSIALYEEGVSKGDSDAMNNLGYMLARGAGIARDERRAFELFKQAADKGNKHAICNLGWMYLHGQAVKKDTARALRCYRKAAAYGVSAALYNLGLMYETGLAVPADFKKSEKFFQLAVSDPHVACDDDMDFIHKTGTLAEKSKGSTLETLSGVRPQAEPAEQTEIESSKIKRNQEVVGNKG